MKLFIPFFLVLSSYTPFIMAQDTIHKKPKANAIIKINDHLKTHHYILDNGLEVFLTPNPKAPNVQVAHWVKAGSLHEKKGTTGIAHLFEHMMFRPLKMGAPSFDQQVDKLGAINNANTRFESTYYHTSVPSKNLNELLKIESERFRNLKVSDGLLDLERGAVWSEYSTKFDSNPMLDLWFQIYRKAFPGHPFGWTIIGFREDLEKIKASDCNEFFNTYYRPNNIGLFITGNFDLDKTLPSVLEN
ncbi:MAG TPA: pitrilysin family protein, partial [Pseudobdellovibrionaceae bacterium]|nr:pitrilysin family protein [Pseudobdellovibrionaceae bacterium]